MVNLFPNYLWKRILNYKGQIIYRRKHSKSGSSMSADSVDNERPSKNSDFDLESNEKIASNVIENPKLRYSLRKAVNNMNSVGIPFLTSNSIIRFLLAIIMCIVLMCAAPDFLTKRSNNYSSIAQINMFRKNLDLCLFRTAKYWSYNLDLAPRQENITDTLGPGILLKDYNNLTISPSDELFKNVVESVKSNEKLGQLLIEVNYKQSANLVGKSNDEIGKFKTGLLHVKNISFCNSKMHKVFETSTSLRYFSLYILNQVSSVTTLNKQYEKPSDWKHDECICEIILNMNNIVSVLNEQSDVLVSCEKIYSDSVEKNLKIMMVIFIPIVFVVFIIPSIVGYFILHLEFQRIFDVLSLLPIKIYKDASKPIAIFQSDIEPTSEAVTQIEHKGCQKLAIILPAIVSTIIITAGLAGVLFLFLDVNKQFYTLVKWLELGSLRAPLVIEIVTHCIFAGIYGYLGSTNYTSHDYHLNMMVNYSRQLLLKHKSLIYGSDQLKPCNKFNSELDDLHFANTCKLNVNGDTFRENYRCLSLDQQVYSLHKLANDVSIAMWNAQRIVEGSNDKQDFNQAFRNILNDYESINLHYLGISYLLPKLEKAQNMLNDGVFLQIDHLKQYTYLITLLVIAISIIIFIIELFVMKKLMDELNIVRILIARLPPISVIKNKQLVELIVGHRNKKLNKLTPISINVRNCSNSVVIFNRKFRIQMVNSSTSKLFGFTKEQLYQSDLSMIISKEDCDIIKDICNRNYKQKENKNQNKNASLAELSELDNEEILSSLLHKYDDDDINLNNSNNENSYTNEQINLNQKPFTKTIIGVKDDSTQAILSSILTYLPEPDDVFALILTDETLLYINEEDTKQAKQRVNEILNQVLPFEIIQNYHMKENVSFSVKQLSVITIKILNFNDMLPHITSVQAVRNMSELFLTYDNQLLNYQTLTKTCVISNYYQAVGGLFNSSVLKKINTSTTEFVDSEYNANNETVVEEEEDNESIIIPNNEQYSSDDNDSDYQQNSKLNNEDNILKASSASLDANNIELDNHQSINLDSESIDANYNEDNASKSSNKSINLNINALLKRRPSKLNNEDNASKSSNKSIKLSKSEVVKRQTSKLNNEDNASKSSNKSINLNINSPLKRRPSKPNNENNASKSSNKSIKLSKSEVVKRQASKLNNANNASKTSNKSINLNNNGSVKNQPSKLDNANNYSKTSSKSINFNESENQQTSKLNNEDNVLKASNRSIVFENNNNNEPEMQQASKLNNEDNASKTSNRSITLDNNNDNNNNESENQQTSKLNSEDNASKTSNRSITFDNNNDNNNEPENQQTSKLNNEDNASKTSNRSINLDNNNDNSNNNNESEMQQTSKLNNEDNVSKASNRSINFDFNNNNNNNNNEPEMQQATKLNNEDDASKASSRSINLDNNNNDGNDNDDDDNEPENQQTSKLNHNNDGISNSNIRSVTFSNKNLDHQIQGIMSIYDAGLLSQNKPEEFHNIILDSIYFAFNCLYATEYINSAFGTNFVIGIGINIGGPCTAGTLGDEHMQFSVVGEAVKTSYCVCNSAEAGNIVISKDVFEQLKESSEAQKNFVFEKYKEIDLPHSKKCKTYLTNLSDVFKQEAQLEESEGGHDDIHHQESLVELENLNITDQQIGPPDE